MTKAEPPAASDLRFTYTRPQGPAGESVVRTDHAAWDAYLFQPGERTPVHQHPHADAFWFVVDGQLSFYDKDAQLIAECGPDDGVVIPRGYVCSIATTSDVPAEAYRFGAADVPLQSADEDLRIVGAAGDGENGPLGGDEAAPSPYAEPKAYQYRAPRIESGKKVDILALTDRGVFGFQVLRAGGETNLHSHPHLDGFWFVRRGKARFYTTDDAVIGELGPNEGVLIPRGYPYWFEAILSHADDECELLQMETADVPISGRREDLNNDRIDYAQPARARSSTF